MSNLQTGKTTSGEALFPYEQAVRQRPDSAEALFNLGVACLHLGLHDRAVAAWEKALRLDPNHLEAQFHLELARSVAAGEAEPLVPPAPATTAPPPSALPAFGAKAARIEEAQPAPHAAGTPPAFSMQYVVTAPAAQVGARSYLESLTPEEAASDTNKAAHQVMGGAENERDGADAGVNSLPTPAVVRRAPRMDPTLIAQQHEALRVLYERRARTQRMVPLAVLGLSGVIAIGVFAALPGLTGAKHSDAPPDSSVSAPAVSTVSSPELSTAPPTPVPPAASNPATPRNDPSAPPLSNSYTGAAEAADSIASPAPTVSHSPERPRPAVKKKIAARFPARPVALRRFHPALRKPERLLARRRTSQAHASRKGVARANKTAGLSRRKPRIGELPLSRRNSGITGSHNDSSDWSPTRPE